MSTDIAATEEAIDRDTPCKNDDELSRWVQKYANLKLPRRSVCPDHHSPFEYLSAAYFQRGDLVVWAPRGGGKTRLAALATVLDMLHKPGCSIRILGGSLDQSLRMWEHLLPDLENIASDLLDTSKCKAKRIELSNGSLAAVLPQSQRAVRGLRVQKLRCDEVELFDPRIWNAAQLATRSIGSPQFIRGTIEAVSTHHNLGGLMGQIIEDAKSAGKTVLKWCLLDVLEQCPASRNCETCPLFEDCQGRAKNQCHGFFSIDDAITMKLRVSKETWDTEMMCRRPAITGSVFPSFDLATHVTDSAKFGPLDDETRSLAIDFGFHNPFVCLWIADDGHNVCVVDEHAQSYTTVEDHIEYIRTKPYGKILRVCCDPAGAGRNDQTAESNIQLLKRKGFTVYSRGSKIVDGLELIRAALRPAYGFPRLFINPGCKKLIAAMQKYHYPTTGGELPVKDGEHDHLIDALRYFFINRNREAGTSSRPY